MYRYAATGERLSTILNSSESVLANHKSGTGLRFLNPKHSVSSWPRCRYLPVWKEGCSAEKKTTVPPGGACCVSSELTAVPIHSRRWGESRRL